MDDPYTLIRNLQGEIEVLRAAHEEQAQQTRAALRRIEERQQRRWESLQEIATALWLDGAEKEAASAAEGAPPGEDRPPLRLVSEPSRRPKCAALCVAGVAAVIIVAALAWQALADTEGTAVRVAEGPPPSSVQPAPPAPIPKPQPTEVAQHDEADDPRDRTDGEAREPRPDMFDPDPEPAAVIDAPSPGGNEPATMNTQQPTPTPAEAEPTPVPAGCTRKIVAVRRVLRACP